MIFDDLKLAEAPAVLLLQTAHTLLLSISERDRAESGRAVHTYDAEMLDAMLSAVDGHFGNAPHLLAPGDRAALVEELMRVVSNVAKSQLNARSDVGQQQLRELRSPRLLVKASFITAQLHRPQVSESSVPYRGYELMVIFDGDLTDEDALLAAKKVANRSEEAGAQVVMNDWWGRRKFAYEIDNKAEGYYLLLGLGSSDGSFIEALDRDLRLNDVVVRHKLVRLPNHEAQKRFGDELPSAARRGSGAV